MGNLQKQLSVGVLRKRWSKNMLKFTGEYPCRSAISMLYNFIEFALRHECFPVNLLCISRTPFPKNTSGGLLLNLDMKFFSSFSAKYWLFALSINTFFIKRSISDVWLGSEYTSAFWRALIFVEYFVEGCFIEVPYYNTLGTLHWLALQ